MTADEIKIVITDHRKLLNGEEGGRRADLRGVNLRGFNLRGVNLSGADLSDANLRDADMRGADLGGAYLCSANMRGANMRSAYLSGADLSDADLSDADLSGADLSGADLSGSDMRGADLGGADMSGSNLRHSIGNMKEIRSAQIDRYLLAWTKDYLQIGRSRYTIDQWESFDDTTIAAMDRGALEWWKRWKKIVLEMVKESMKPK